MTILHYRSPQDNVGHFIAVSDVIISMNCADQGAFDSWILHKDRTTTNGIQYLWFRQKSILVSNKVLFQWAGRLLFAIDFLKRLRKIVQQPEFLDNPDAPIVDLISEYSSEELAVCVHVVIKAGELRTFGLNNAELEKEGNDLVLYDGTGGQLMRPGFTNSIIEQTEHSAKYGGRHIDTISAIRSCIIAELGAALDSPFFYFGSGGWYEIAVLDNSAFKKIPLAVIVYKYYEGALYLMHVSVSRYDDELLYVSSLDLKEKRGSYALVFPPDRSRSDYSANMGAPQMLPISACLIYVVEDGGRMESFIRFDDQERGSYKVLKTGTSGTQYELKLGDELNEELNRAKAALASRGQEP